LENLDKENQITLTTYLSVMEDLFNAIRDFDEKLFFALLDFQEIHINELAIKFK